MIKSYVVNVSKNQELISSVIILRGIASVMVCCLHVNLLSNFHFNQFTDFVIDNGSLGINIFFIISGFVLPYSLYIKNYTFKNLGYFLLKRSIRIDPAYWATIILVLIFTSVPNVNLVSIILHLTYLVPFFKENWFSHLFWTLSIEFQYYLLLGIFFPLLMRLTPYFAIAVLLLISMFFITVNFNFDGIIATYLYNFVAGFILFMGYIKKISFKVVLSVTLLFSIYLMIFVSIKSGLISLITSLFILFYKRKTAHPLFSFLGNISYSLYLTHTIISYVIFQQIHKYIASATTLFFICIGFCVAFAYVFYILIEKPCIKLSKSIHIA